MPSSTASKRLLCRLLYLLNNDRSKQFKIRGKILSACPVVCITCDFMAFGDDSERFQWVLASLFPLHMICPSTVPSSPRRKNFNKLL